MLHIHNRRYLGSKTKLLPFITDIINQHCHDCHSFMDLFGGTGVVAHHFSTSHNVIVNDLLKSNVFVYEAFLSPAPYDKTKIQQLLDGYNAIQPHQTHQTQPPQQTTKQAETEGQTFTPPNYYEKNFADTFLSRANMQKVGIIRDDIDNLSQKQLINDKEKAILITSLLYAIDKIANTVGHYDAYRRTGELDKPLFLDMLALPDNTGDNTGDGMGNGMDIVMGDNGGGNTSDNTGAGILDNTHSTTNADADVATTANATNPIHKTNATYKTPKPQKTPKTHQIFNEDANQLVKQVACDILYLDPPYNSRQYCDAYHFLENVAVNNKPEVVGVARKMDRSHLKSHYCTQKAVMQFRQLIQDAQARYIIVSYNNTGNKINSRSNAKISDVEILDILSAKGKVHVYEKDFNAFTTGKTQLDEHKERLFVCEVAPNNQGERLPPHMTSTPSTPSTSFAQSAQHTHNPQHTQPPQNATQTTQHGIGGINGIGGNAAQHGINGILVTGDDNQPFVKSPLNYTGGKHKLLPQLVAKLPNRPITTFYDIFTGGGNVGVNMQAQHIICVDKNPQVIELLQYLQHNQYGQLIEQIDELVAHYQLSNSYQNGYAHYQCDSSGGLGSHNKAGYLALRQQYNQNPSPLLFLMLIIFGFNNQVRFNAKGEFNMPVGKRDFNASLRKKLLYFMQKLKNQPISFMEQDFEQLDLDILVAQDAFLYLDPPYLLGTAAYNENGGWSEQDEKRLLDFLRQADEKGVSFALSNVVRHKGQTHELLLDWCLENGFNIHHLDYHYNNASYQRKQKTMPTQEVLITNY